MLGEVARDGGEDRLRPGPLVALATHNVQRHTHHKRCRGIGAREDVLRDDEIEHVRRLAAMLARQREFEISGLVREP